MATLTLRTARWTGDHETRDGEEQQALAILAAEIDGIPLDVAPHLSPEPRPKLTLDADGFLACAIENPSEELWRAFSDPAKHLLGSSGLLLRLAITDLVVEPATRKDWGFHDGDETGV